MADGKLVSVCINAYNSADVIAQTIESVLNQTYKNLQIIVVDDCSTDNTAEIVKSFDDDRIELYTLPKNGNISNANNECLHRARGEYIAHLDSDDIWIADKIEKQVKFLEENPQYGACFSHAGLIDENSRLIQPDDPCPQLYDTYIVDNMSQAQFVRFCYEKLNRICHCSMVMRRSVYEKVGDHDLSMKYLHDFDYWVRMNFCCPFYIIQEKLVFCRVRRGNNSTLGEKELVAHNEELARIMYKLINDCPREMFLEAFSDMLRIKGEHTDEEVELEKAFVLANAFLLLPENKILEMRKLDELFREKKYVELAEEKFGFTLRDFYELHKSEVYYDKRKADALSSEAASARENTENLEQKLETCEMDKAFAKREHKKYVELAEVYADTKAELDSLTAEYTRLAAQYNLMANSRSYKLFAPWRKLKALFAKLSHAKPRRTLDGRKVRARIVLYGYYYHNIGDDLFFDMLFKRYPDVMFYTVWDPIYSEFFSHYPNVRFYDTTRPLVKRINAIGHRLHKTDLFEKLLIRLCDGAMHIGGSVYQQVGDWQNDFARRKGRKLVGKEFFAVSNNFGPYSIDSYRDMWEDEFKKWTDICFRDRYSYDLFKQLPNVRYAPDAVFGYPIKRQLARKKVAISVIDAFSGDRHFSRGVARTYENTLVEMIKSFIDDGYTVSLLGFCEYENDSAAVERITAALPEETAKSVKSFSYYDDFYDTVNEIETSEYVIATRFHAMVLGYIAGKKVLPLCYSEKTSNVITDLELSDKPIMLENIGDYTARQLIDMAELITADRADALCKQSRQQFAGFDKFVKKHRGEIVE